MNINPQTSLAASGREEKAPIDWSWKLPLRSVDFHAALAPLYHDAIAGAATPELAAGLCRELARLLGIPLVLLSRRLPSGGVAIEAASRESAVWLELQRLPERWDSGISSRGPAGEALRTGAVVHMPAGDGGFALWHKAALGDRIDEILAFPVGADLVLELFCGSRMGEGARSGTLAAQQLAAGIARFLDDVASLQRNGLLARALEGAGTGAFLTDLEGTILWSNRAFSALSGYAAADVRGRKASILRSGEQGLRYYRDLWSTIRAGEVWSGETVDRAKDGTQYAIQQTISPVATADRITHYLSIHQDIGRQRSARARLELASHVDPATGLLTRAAFGAAARAQLGASSTRGSAALVLVTLRGLQRTAALLDEEVESAALKAIGEQLRAAATGTLGALGPFEYALLLSGADAEPAALQARLDAIAVALAEPLPMLGGAPGLDLHFGVARYPEEGADLRELMFAADRRLANEPHRRARRIQDTELP